MPAHEERNDFEKREIAEMMERMKPPTRADRRREANTRRHRERHPHAPETVRPIDREAQGRALKAAAEEETGDSRP